MSNPIWMKDECGADAITKLLNNGMDLDQRDLFLYGGTVLHYWAGTPYVDRKKKYINSEKDKSRYEDSLAVVKLIIEKGADLRAVKRNGFTPLLEAATGLRGERSNLEVLDFLLERQEYSRAEKIEALELAGAVILGNLKNTSSFQKALEYWRKALQLRQLDEDGSGPIPKTILNLKSVRTTEWITSAELEDVIDHPDTYVIQSFLVRIRILFYKSWEALETLLDWDWDKIIRQLNKEGRIVDIFDILCGMLETFCRFDSCEKSKLEWMTRTVVRKLIEVFSWLEEYSSDSCNSEIINKSLNLMISSATLHRVGFLPFVELAEILLRLPPVLNKGALKILSELRDHSGQNLLHLVLIGGSSGYYGNPYVTILPLLNAGCGPTAIDVKGNAPLHYLASLRLPNRKIKDLNNTARLLLDFGAQRSLKNADGKTAVELWIQMNGSKRIHYNYGNEEIIDWKVPDWCNELPTLTSLSARVIRRNRIPHLKLPASLILMIEKHKITQ